MTPSPAPPATGSADLVLDHLPARRAAAVLVQGGYFDTTTGPDAFAHATVELAQAVGAVLRAEEPRHTVLFDLLLNDLGSACGTDVCTVTPAAGSATADPTPLLRTVADPRRRPTVIRERTLRNRVARRLGRALRRDLFPEWARVEGGELVMDSEVRGTIRLGALHTDRVVPRCPLIMGEYYRDAFARLRAAAPQKPRVVVDFCAAADKDKVLRGIEVCFRDREAADETLVAVFTDSRGENPVDLAFTRRDFP